MLKHSNIALLWIFSYSESFLFFKIISLLKECNSDSYSTGYNSNSSIYPNYWRALILSLIDFPKGKLSFYTTLSKSTPLLQNNYLWYVSIATWYRHLYLPKLWKIPNLLLSNSFENLSFSQYPPSSYWSLSSSYQPLSPIFSLLSSAKESLTFLTTPHRIEKYLSFRDFRGLSTEIILISFSYPKPHFILQLFIAFSIFIKIVFKTKVHFWWNSYDSQNALHFLHQWVNDQRRKGSWVFWGFLKFHYSCLKVSWS